MTSHPLGEIGVIEVVVLDERYGGLGGLHILRGVHDDGFLRFGLNYLHILAHRYIRAKPHGEAHNQAEAHLSHNFEAAFHAVLVVTMNLQIVVKETERAEPYRGHEHQSHVDVAQIAHEQTRHKNRHDYYDATHGGGAFFRHLALKAKIADYLAHLHQLQTVYYPAPEHCGYNQRQHESRAGTERDVVHEPRAGHTESLEIIKKIIKHFALLLKRLGIILTERVRLRRRPRAPLRGRRNDVSRLSLPGRSHGLCRQSAPHRPFRRARARCVWLRGGR